MFNKSYIVSSILFVFGYLCLCLMLFVIYKINMEYVQFSLINSAFEMVLILAFITISVFLYLARNRAIFYVLLTMSFSFSIFGSCALVAGFIWLALFPPILSSTLIFLLLLSLFLSFNKNKKKLSKEKGINELKRFGILDFYGCEYRIDLWAKKADFYKHDSFPSHPLISKVQGIAVMIFVSGGPIILGLSFGFSRIGREDLRYILLSIIAYVVSFAFSYFLLPAISLLKIILNLERESGSKVKAVYI